MGCKLKITIKGLALEARNRAPKIVCSKVGWLLDRSRQKASLERTVCHEADAEFATRRERSISLYIARPERIFALKCRDWMHSDRASQGADARLRKSQLTNFSRPNQLGHRPDGFFDKHAGIDPVLVIQIDKVNP